MTSETDRYSTRSTDYPGMTKAQVIKRAAKVLFSAYRRDNYADPEGFVVQLGVLFEKYNPEVIDAVTDPRSAHALQLTHKFPPTLAEIKEACDQEAERRFKIARASNQPRPQLNRYYAPAPKFPGCRANVFVHADAPQYPMLLERSQSPGVDECDWREDDRGRAGIWVVLSWIETLGADRWRRPSADLHR